MDIQTRVIKAAIRIGEVKGRHDLDEAMDELVDFCRVDPEVGLAIVRAMPKTKIYDWYFERDVYCIGRQAYPVERRTRDVVARCLRDEVVELARGCPNKAELFIQLCPKMADEIKAVCRLR